MPCFYGIVTYIYSFFSPAKREVVRDEVECGHKSRIRKKFHIFLFSFFTHTLTRFEIEIQRGKNRGTDTQRESTTIIIVIITWRSERGMRSRSTYLVLIQIRHGRSGCDDWNFCFHGSVHALFRYYLRESGFNWTECQFFTIKSTD